MAGELFLVTQALGFGTATYLLLPKHALPSRKTSLESLRIRFVRAMDTAQDWALFVWISERQSMTLLLEELQALLWRRGAMVLSLPGCVAVLGLGLVGVGLVCSWFSASLVGLPLGCVIGLFWMRMHSIKLEQKRQQALLEEMPSLFRSLSSSLAAGRSLAQSIEHVAGREEGPAAPAFRRAAMRLRCSMSVSDVLVLLKEELDAPGVGLLVNALSISQRNGSPLGEILEQAAELVERQGEFEQLLKVKTAQVRLSAHIVCALPPALAAILMLISPDYQAGLASPVGIGCLLIALALDAVALFSMRIMMKGVL